ncbi:MAG: gliding motility-associated C-terminal domain-containing protein [Bacteroidales bacterium]|nr:gliding motility-associated C-terminal domain-containing protein [Bacteroidales bacterium]MDT8372664.1 gliding motility-associated C-terminal domain-containing protein [Bacteroidales bacterium]
MKPLTRLTLLFSLTVAMPGLYGQQDGILPAVPVPENVTVDPYTGNCTLSWIPSVSTDVERYIIYASDSLYGFLAIDSVPASHPSEYLHANSFARYRSTGYSVAARDSSGNRSPMSDPLWTVYLAAENDSCNSRINLSWTPHVNVSHPSDRYELWLSVAEEPVALILTLPKTDTSYNFSDYLPGSDYCIFIIASDEEGAAPSSSNRQCITTGAETTPGWMQITALSVVGGGLVVTGSYDRESTMDNFIVLRYDEGIPGWSQCGTTSGFDGTVVFTIADADTNRITPYTLAVLNSCGIAADSSLPVRNIVLTSEMRGTQVNLFWNRPGLSPAPVYSIWRDTGKGWQEAATGLSDTLWSEELSLLAGTVTSASVAYRVTASSDESPAGTPPSQSNVTLVPITERIYMPNAFTPDGDGLNDLFMPALSFIPVGYEFSIYTRSGVVLFRTSDYGEGWDGHHNGSLMPSGVYLWSLRLTTPSGQTEVRRGTVTILP